MKKFDSQIEREIPALCKYRQLGVLLTLLIFLFAADLRAQGGGPCSGITFSFDHYEPCHFRARYNNTTDCFTEIRYSLESGTFSSWDVNAPAGFTVDVISPSELWIHHNQGFLPLGDQVPLLFTLPYDLNTTMHVAYLDNCAQIGCEVIGGIPIESCPDPQDASIIGVKYRECGALPYIDQEVIPGWTIQLLDADSNLIAEQVTDADGRFGIYDLPHGVYVLKETAKPGWTPNVPPSGMYTVDLGGSQQVERNFGNCPSCSCDEIYMNVVQLPVSSDTCSYALNVSNSGAYCFKAIDLKLTAGSFTSVIPAAGWTATFISPQHYKLTFPPSYIPAQSFLSTLFKVTGAAQHDITVSTSYLQNGTVVTCSQPFSYQCPPPAVPPPCCPPGSTFGPELVINGDFSLGNQYFTNNYNYFLPGNYTAIGSYSVLDYGQVFLANSQWACIDHTTYTTSGLMLIVDGYNGPVAWQQQVNVTAGTNYAFSAWVNNLVNPARDYADPQMALFVDGIQVGGPLTLPENPDQWVRLCDTFLVQQTGLVTLSIRMLATTDIGNDVAIDDISVRRCIPPPDCACPLNAFSNMSYKQNSGPSVPISCGQIASWQCQLPNFTLNGDFMCQGADCPVMPPIYWTLNHPNLGQVDQGTASGPGFQISTPNSSFSAPGLYTLTLKGICGVDTCYCDIIIETPGCGNTCQCKTGDLTYSSGGNMYTIPCMSGPNVPVFFCPTGPVNISGAFGCVDANGNPCSVPPAPINWTLFHNGIVQQGVITNGSPWSLPFTAADLAGSGFFTLYMTTLCPGQPDSCKCVATWFQECVQDTCKCGPNPWDLEFRYGGAQNQPVMCGETLNVTTGSAFYPTFNCQGPPNCGRVDWELSGPNGYLQSMTGVVPGPGGVFVIPPLQPTTFPGPGTYTLQMNGICGQDTCPCTVYFCLPPLPPTLNDTSICRAHQSAYIPLQGCPTGCDIAEVQWFVKPCSASTWPPIPYQTSSAGNPQNCDDLLFLPYQYSGETCVQVYAVIKLDPGCCVPDLTSNIATINLCNPITCSINNPNTQGFCQTGQPLALTGVVNGANCNYTVEWYDDNGQLVSNSLTYTPPVLTFPSGSTDCYKDFTFTMKVIGICGPSTCSTSIRVYNRNADNGDLVMDPVESQPFCPGEDARLTYQNKCSGPPPKWQWYSSTVSGTSGFTSLSGTGMMNPVYYTNQLYQTTWYMVQSQNGVCPAQQDILKIEVKDAIVVHDFTVVPDPCINQQAVLTVVFTPSPIAPGCLYVIDWYHNGTLIHTSTATASPVSYTYPGPDIPGVYYAVVHDNCCPASVQTSPVEITRPCKPVISGPCYKCDMTTPVTLHDELVLPPKDACTSSTGCTYQWYVLDVVPEPDVWVPLPGETSPDLTILKGGHYKLETSCNYGYGTCTQEAYHDVAQCMGCMYVGEEEIPLPAELKVTIQPNPTTGNVTVQINPALLRKGRVEIVDLNGNLLLDSKIPEAQSSVTLSLGHLPNGLYFVRIYESDVLLWTGKVVRSE